MTKRCEICKLDLQDDYSYQGHLQGKKHLKNANLQSLIMRSIFVSRIPRNISQKNLINFFLQFDEILKYKFGLNYLIIEFKTIGPIEYLLTQPIYIKGIKLNISPRSINDSRVLGGNEKNFKQEAINGTEDLIYDNIKSIFEVESTFEQQVTAFLDKVAISNSEIAIRYVPTCEALNEIFRSVFPNCKTYRFGSTVSGLGFKNCDLDIFLEDVSHKINSTFKCNVFATRQIFSKVKKILYAKTALFSNVLPIPRAKTPIIKFTYIPEEISCDISFKNSLAVHNSQLIKFYLSLDPHLRPTMMILKYWVCNYEFRERNKISKYALTLLFIFYLQQPNIKLVPPVIELKKNCIPEVVEGWQVNFEKTLENCRLNENDRSNVNVPILLHGFFQFYANYDFKSNIVCCIDGFSHSKMSFNKTEKLPECMERYKKYLEENPIIFSTVKPMCVQDPNELNYNVTGNVCEEYLNHFQKYCAAASEICLNSVENNYKELLPSIFSLKFNVESEQTKFKFMFQLPQLGDVESIKSNSTIIKTTSVQGERCFNLVVDLIKQFLENVLKFQVQFSNQQEELKQQKTEIESDVHSKDQKKIIMHCTGKYYLWRGRKNKLNCVFDPSISLLEKEIAITKNILENLNSKDDLTKLKIDFDCHIVRTKLKNENFIRIVLLSHFKKQIFNGLASYIKDKLPIVIKKTLFHMQQFKKNEIKINQL